MNTISKAALLACTALALTACGGDDSTDFLNIGNPSARLVNAMPDGPPLALYRNADAQTDAGTPTYEESSQYFDTVTATSTWSIRDASTNLQIGSTTLAASGSTRYTFVAFPGAGTLADMVTIADPFDVGLITDNARMRVVNGSLNSGTFDLYLSAPGADITAASPTMGTVAYEGASPVSGSNSYSFPSGTYEIRLTLAGTKTVFFDGTLTAGKNDDLLLVTLPNSDVAGDVKILDVTDSSVNSEILNNAP